MEVFHPAQQDENSGMPYFQTFLNISEPFFISIDLNQPAMMLLLSYIQLDHDLVKVTMWNIISRENSHDINIF